MRLVAVLTALSGLGMAVFAAMWIEIDDMKGRAMIGGIGLLLLILGVMNL